MGIIRLLPGELANQIAAGEVVERPASVVKELVENALDAGATRVRVTIERGGVDVVQVNDDGRGMDAADATLCLERHATSKIRHKDDLFALETFGFRGEALPSIASVSKLRLVTRARGAQEATEVVTEGGTTPQARPTGAPEGTTIEVRDLFFNVPARRKFLKSTGTEAAHAGEAVLLAALTRPDVAFFLLRDGRMAREWLRAETRRERATQAFEGEPLESCIAERGALRIEAHLGAPERARSGAVGLHLVVNGRAVRDRALARAVAQAYGSVLEPGRYPIGVVYLELPPALVDVNVHPQKAEVRFTDARSVFDVVTRELHEALAKAFGVPSLARPRGQAHALLAPTPPSREPPPETGERWPSPPPRAPVEIGFANGSPLAVAEPRGVSPAPLMFEGPGFYGSLDYLAQLRSTYLLCGGADALYIVDQHAAAERVLFHRLRTSFASRSIPMQQLLVAEVVQLSPAEYAIVEERSEAVAALGVDLRPISGAAVAVHAVPALLEKVPPERVVRDVVAELGRLSTRPFADVADRIIATMACHGSVRAGDTLGREQAVALLRALDGIDFSGHCPHGRPILTRIGYDELERRVGR